MQRTIDIEAYPDKCKIKTLEQFKHKWIGIEFFNDSPETNRPKEERIIDIFSVILDPIAHSYARRRRFLMNNFYFSRYRAEGILSGRHTSSLSPYDIIRILSIPGCFGPIRRYVLLALNKNPDAEPYRTILQELPENNDKQSYIYCDNSLANLYPEFFEGDL